MPVQRTVLWIVFSMSLLFLWDKWMAVDGKPSIFSPAPQAASVPNSGGAAPAGGATKAPSDVPQAEAPKAPVAGAAAIPNSPAPAIPATVASKIIRLSNDVIAIDIDTVGGQLRRSELLAHQDIEKKEINVLLLQDQPGKVFLAQSGLTGAPAGSSFPNHRTPMQVGDESKASMAAGNQSFVTLIAQAGDLQLTRTYTLNRGSYTLDVKDDIKNLGAVPLQPTLYMQLVRDTHKPPGESQFYSTYTGPAIYSDKAKFSKVDFSDIDKKKTPYEVNVNDGWVGIIQHYFVTAWIPTDKAARVVYTDKVEDKGLYTVGVKQPLAPLASGANSVTDSRLYIGPQDQKVLEKVAPGLELTVDYGWLTVVAKPIFWLLQYLHGLVGNWGWAIILLTIVIKTMFFPLQAASYKSMARMKAVTPKMTALREKFGSDKMKLNQAMMELYKTEKINPLGGCLPVVVQIPVFIALYWVLLASVEMRSAPWMLWIKDLATPDPYFILPLLMAGTMIIQTRLNPTPVDPVQAKMMQWMPVIFSIMFFFFPAGLVLYWLVNNLYSIAQQWFITSKIEAAAAAAK